jgi:uncharacterized protein YndB with AHSA1/START domain
MKTETLVIEGTFNATADAVWQAITDKNQMKKWYFDIAEFKPEAGIKFQFYPSKDNLKYLHLCEIKEVITGKKLAYTWKYKDYPGDSLLKFELFAENGKTRLKLTHSGLESFPANNPDFAKESFVKGWTYIIDTSLKNFLENNKQAN